MCLRSTTIIVETLPTLAARRIARFTFVGFSGQVE